MSIFQKFLKSLHNFFLLFGLNISFVKKRNRQSAIEMNSLEAVNTAFSDIQIQSNFASSEHIVFFNEIIGLLKEHSIDLSGSKVADVGCGIGDLINEINTHFRPKECYGYDFSEVAVRIAQKRFPEFKFCQHDLYTELSEKFDFVFCTEVLEHLLFPEKAIKNILESSKGKNIFLTVPDGRTDTFEGHINFWSIESWKIFIESNCPDCHISFGYLNNYQNLYALIKDQK